MTTAQRTDYEVDDEVATVRLNAFGALGEKEMSGLRQIAGPERGLDRGDTLWHEGDRLPGLFLLLEGWIGSRRSAGDTAARLSRVHLPGDVLGFPSLAYAGAGESMVALTAAKVRPLRLHSIGALFEAEPRVAAMMFMVSLQERMDLADRLVAASQEDAKVMIATWAVLLMKRLTAAFGEGESFRLPLNDTDLAELVGLPQSRLDAGLQELRDANVLTWSKQRLTVLDRPGLTQAAKLPDRTLASDPYWLPTAN